jgi:class 3 adenylate cyclase
MCTACFERAPIGGAEIQVGVLFADVRGYTTLIVSESVYALVGDRFPGANLVELNLKGKSEPVAAHVIEIAARDPVTARG